jgi:hypothetical protein
MNDDSTERHSLIALDSIEDLSSLEKSAKNPNNELALQPKEKQLTSDKKSSSILSKITSSINIPKPDKTPKLDLRESKRGSLPKDSNKEVIESLPNVVSIRVDKGRLEDDEDIVIDQVVTEIERAKESEEQETKEREKREAQEEESKSKLYRVSCDIAGRLYWRLHRTIVAAADWALLQWCDGISNTISNIFYRKTKIVTNQSLVFICEICIAACCYKMPLVSFPIVPVLFLLAVFTGLGTLFAVSKPDWEMSGVKLYLASNYRNFYS